MSGVPYSLSFHFMMEKVEGFKECIEAEDKQKFEEFLYALGMDVKQGYDIVSVEHRPYNNKPFSWYGPRAEGYERTDDAYLRSGVASLDAHIAACPDVSKRVALQMLNPRGAISSWEED